ncbi:BMP family ABC transporter substrate-binding protein [Galbitalea soli]|uniref:BMP family ABC transporter substrate-binding protein n=1 Tax=Galbitalea soli TaxID=1268042 RepID=A0A7C9TQR0_9MICO|nr:BMP family ABC transporter substrate-binding protein [Galbitalea soli]NYJ30191.1 basic membrane protein A [Galbitalea soli]
MAAATIAVLAVLTACSSATPSASSTSSSGAVAKPKVAVILGGLQNDGGFNEYVADAAKTLVKEGKISLSIRESVTTATDSEPIMRQYAAEGYNLIIGWGIGFSDSVFKVAKEDPNTDFVATGGEDILKQATKNVETWTFSSEQDGYLIGWIAGKTGVDTVGVVDGELAAFNETTYKYVDYGLKASNPSVKVLKPIFTGSWTDSSLANQAAKAQIAAGAKLIITGAEGYTPGVLSAAKQAGIATLGASKTSSSDAAAVNIGLVSLDFTPALRSIVGNVASGDFANKSYIATIDNGGLVFNDLNPVAAAPGVTSDLGAQITALGKSIVDGTTKIPATLP